MDGKQVGVVRRGLAVFLRPFLSGRYENDVSATVCASHSAFPFFEVTSSERITVISGGAVMPGCQRVA
jgi:hypothetical protein